MNANKKRLFQFFTLFSITMALNAPASGFEFPCQVFDGTSMNGWVVTGSKVSAKEDVLLLESGDGFIRTAHRYSDFVLELQWRNVKPKNFDSGIYVRCELPKGKRVWPKQYQINLKESMEGTLIGNKSGKVSGLAKNGQWNRLKLTMRGSVGTLEINGKKAWEIDGFSTLDGYIGFQSEVPLGGQFEFKNIVITELNHKSIFNKMDLTGWESANPKSAECWVVKNGNLVCTGEKGTWLRLKEKVDDFNLRMEYKVSEGGNSGVYVRVPKNGNHHGKGAGLEVQILDDSAEKYKNLKPYQYSASLYAVKPASPNVSKKAGQWNQLEIDIKGGRYKVSHNGIVVVETDSEQTELLKERLKAGFIGLQNHNTKVWFRNLRMGKSMQ